MVLKEITTIPTTNPVPECKCIIRINAKLFYQLNLKETNISNKVSQLKLINYPQKKLIKYWNMLQFQTYNLSTLKLNREDAQKSFR